MIELRVVAESDFGAASLAAFLESLEGFESPAVGLATGNTPVALYAALRQAVVAGQASVAHIRPFAIDEYGGPRDHPCSNRAFFREHWETIPGAGPVAQFDPEAPGRDAEARRFGELLRRAGGLDVAILGIGVNGHLAFNEPGAEKGGTAAAVRLTATTIERSQPCWGAAAPDWGLTLGLSELLGARRVLLLANGAHKAHILRAAVRGPMSPECPASWLQEHGGVVVVADEAAGAADRSRGPQWPLA